MSNKNGLATSSKTTVPDDRKKKRNWLILMIKKSYDMRTMILIVSTQKNNE
jgi:hypothetical protein